MTDNPDTEIAASLELQETTEWRLPQLLDLKEAIIAADNGEFASKDEVDAWFAHHGC
jgi:hypothetical protein